MRLLPSLALALALAHSGSARAAGLGRPNVASARGIGQGGAFTPVADDATALHFNPAGMALQADDSVLVGAELILAPRTYKPLLMDGTYGPEQSPHDKLNAVPALGYVTRLSSRGVPSRAALGIGVWNTFGGQLEYDKGDPSVPALDKTQTAIIEIVPGAAYEVNDFLAVGFGFRLGIGLFSVDATAKPNDGSFSALGVGAGATLGAMLRPSKRVNVGLVWRSAISTNLSGDGTIELQPDVRTPIAVNHRQDWPQQAAIGVAWRLSDRLRLATQLDWTDWSKLEKIVIEFPGMDDLTKLATFHVDFQDSWAAHVGGEYTASDRLALRAGYTFDSNAVPDRTIERQYLDAPKHAAAIGASYGLGRRWRIDTAFEYVFGPVRHVPDNRQEWIDAGWPERANVSPGDHSGNVYTLELALQYRY